MSSVDGLITGLNTTSIINQLMAAERIPQNQLRVQQATAEAEGSVLSGIRSRYDSVKAAAQKLKTSADWGKLSATSTSDLVGVSADTGSLTGSVSFTVTQRASAKSVYSTQTVASLDAVVAAGGSVFSARDYAPLGFSDLSGTGLALGAQTFQVTQESNAAVKAGTTALPDISTIDATNDSLTLSVNGTSHTLTLTHGSFTTAADLAGAVRDSVSAVAGLPAQLDVLVNPLGQLDFVTKREGSAASVQLTGGTAVGTIGMTTDATAAIGVDGVITANGATTTVSNTDRGTVVTVAAGVGSISATLSGGIRLGSAVVEQVSYGTGSLQEVVAAINGAGSSGTKASIVQVAANSYRLQLTATETGAASALDVDLTEFTGLTGFTTLSNGADASIQIEGLNPYTITSSSDTFQDVMPGVDITLKGTPAGTVTVNASRDVDTIADQLAGLVTAVNGVLDDIDAATSYDTTNNKGSILTGNSTVRRARDALVGSLLQTVAGSSLGTVGLAGVSIQKDGSFKFDRDTFIKQYDANPAEVERLFVAPAGSTDKGAIDRILSEVDSATAFGSGYIRSAEDAANARVTSLQDSISGWDIRLASREKLLRGVYTRLETNLSQLQSQSTWLSGQIASLSNTTSNN